MKAGKVIGITIGFLTLGLISYGLYRKFGNGGTIGSKKKKTTTTTTTTTTTSKAPDEKAIDKLKDELKGKLTPDNLQKFLNNCKVKARLKFPKKEQATERAKFIEACSKKAAYGSLKAAGLSDYREAAYY